MREAAELQTVAAQLRRARRSVPGLPGRAPAHFEVLTTHKIKSITMRISTLFFSTLIAATKHFIPMNQCESLFTRTSGTHKEVLFSLKGN